MKTLTVECSNSRQSKEYSEADCSVGHGKAHWINPCPVQGYYNAKIEFRDLSRSPDTLAP